MCPFNKIHLHSYLTTLLKTKDEQLPHAKHSLHLHVLTIIPKHEYSSLKRTTKEILRQHTPLRSSFTSSLH